MVVLTISCRCNGPACKHSATVAAGVCAAHFQAKHLATIDTLEQFHGLHSKRSELVCVGSHTVDCQCIGCYELRKMMRDQYHVKDDTYEMTPEEAQAEIVMRLAYEVMFGFLDIRHVYNGTWMQPGIHDYGHHKRYINLWQRASLAPFVYSWLPVVLA